MEGRNRLTWLHLSEWQQQGEAFDRERVRDALFKDLLGREEMDPALGQIDLVLFTGDVAFAGKPQEYRPVIYLLFDPVLQMIGLDRDRLFVVPGNHDLDRDVLEGLPQGLTGAASSDGEVRKLLGDDSARSALLKPFEAFAQFAGNYTGQERPEYASTRVVEVAGRGAALLGLNSAWMCGRRREGGDLGLDYGYAVVGEPQIDQAVDLSGPTTPFPLVRIALLHHPLDWLASFDRPHVEPRLVRDCHFVLHGVSPGVRVVGERGGECVFISAGPCYDHPADAVESHRSGYNLVSLDFETGRGSAFLRTWSTKDSRWVADPVAGEGGRFDFDLPKELAKAARRRKKPPSQEDVTPPVPQLEDDPLGRTVVIDGRSVPVKVWRGPGSQDIDLQSPDLSGPIFAGAKVEVELGISSGGQAGQLRGLGAGYILQPRDPGLGVGRHWRQPLSIGELPELWYERVLFVAPAQPGDYHVEWVLFVGDDPDQVTILRGKEPAMASLQVVRLVDLLAEGRVLLERGAEEQKRWLALLGQAAALPDLPADDRRRLVLTGLVPALSSPYLTVRPKALAALYAVGHGDQDVEAMLRSTFADPNVDLKTVRALVNDRKAMKSARDWLAGLLPEPVDVGALLAALPDLPAKTPEEQKRWLEQASRAGAQPEVPRQVKQELVEKGLATALSSPDAAVQRCALDGLLSLRGSDPGIDDSLRRALAEAPDKLAAVRELAQNEKVPDEGRYWLNQTVAQVTILARYEPPPPAHRLTAEVTPSLVKLSFGAQDGYGPPQWDHKALEEAKGKGDWQRYGELLFDAIVHAAPSPGGGPTTASVYDAAMAATGGQVRFELKLVQDGTGGDALDLHGLRWEALKKKGDAPLAVVERTPFYRRLLVPQRKLRVTGDRLKIVVTLCLPKSLGQTGQLLLDTLSGFTAGEEKKIFDRALQRLQFAGLAEYRVLGADDEEVTLEMLTEAVQEGCHVLHVVCHGLSLPVVDGYRLVMARFDDDELPLVTAQEFEEVAAAGTELRLVVLAACQGAQTTTGITLGALGPRLVQAGIPAVVAMQDRLPFTTAQLFAQHFYDDLARSGRVDMALAATRLAIYQKEGAAEGTWGIPVLYTRADLGSDDGKLMDVDPRKAAGLPELVPDVRGFDPAAGQVDPRLRALQQHVEAGARAIGLPQLVSAVDQAVGATGTGPALAPRQDRGSLSRLKRPLALVATYPKPGAAPNPEREEDEDKTGLRGFVWQAAGLRLSSRLYAQIADSLNMGKHIVLIGPPGTGKTTLAQALCQYAAANGFATGVAYTTATADWTTFDTVGGHVPGGGGVLQFRAGCFLEAICEGKWLVIDEINRAEIDKAFGELFTVVAGQAVDCPYWVGEHQVRVLPADRKGRDGWIPEGVRSPYDYVVHPNWRMVGTMNVYDKSSLFAMSLAFMRRFAFIDLDLPDEPTYDQLFKRWVEEQPNPSLALALADREALLAKLKQLLDFGVPAAAGAPARAVTMMQRRALGPAIVRDMVAYVSRRYAHKAAGEDVDDLAAEAFLLYAAPQLDALDRDAIWKIYEELRDIFGAKARPILHRIRDLYPYVKEGEWPA